MVSEGYKLKIAFTTASKMTLCVFSCLGWSQIPQKNSEYPRTSAGYERGYGPRGRVSSSQHDSERRSNTKTKFLFLEKLSLQCYRISKNITQEYRNKQLSLAKKKKLLVFFKNRSGTTFLAEEYCCAKAALFMLASGNKSKHELFWNLWGKTCFCRASRAASGCLRS